MTYRQAPIREKIDPPWGRTTRSVLLARAFGAAGLAASVALGVLADPIAGLAALILVAGTSLTVHYAGGADRSERTRDPQGPEEPLRRAGLQPVGWTEWRAEREGFPVRVQYSALSLRARVEVALGSAPGFLFVVSCPPVAGGDVTVGPWSVSTDRAELARTIVVAAQRRCLTLPGAFETILAGRVLRTTVMRFASPEGYQVVLSALDLTLAMAQAFEANGEGLAPFRR